MGTLSNIKIQPMKVIWGDDIVQIDQVTIPSDSSGSMNNKYFYCYLPTGAQYYVWFNINSAGADPSIAGATAVPIAAATGATGSTLAADVVTALNAITGFDTSHSGAILSIGHDDPGYATPPHLGLGTFTFTPGSEGDAAEDIGFTDGNIEVTVGEASETIQSHQTGKTNLGKIQTGFNMKVKVSFKETSALQMRRVLIKQGDTYMPSGDDKTQLVGMGNSKQFLANTGRQRALTLHPVVLMDADKSQDVNFWKADAVLANLTFSGDKVLMLPIDFDIYQDATKPAEINLFAIGDASQLS